MLSATTWIIFQRSFNNESEIGDGILALSLSPLTLHANAIKAENKMKEYFFMKVIKLKNPTLKNQSWIFIKEIFFYWLIKSKSSRPISSDTVPPGPPSFT